MRHMEVRRRPNRLRRWSVSLVVAVLSMQCGLGSLGNAVRDSTTDTMAVLDKAIDSLGADSSNWRQVVESALKDLPAEASSLVRNELSDALARGVATAGVETRCTIDFIGNRMRQQLLRLRAMLVGTDAPLPEPALCEVVPLVVDMSLAPAARNKLELFGYDFDTTDIQVLHVTASGSTDVTSKLTRPSRYQMTLNLSANGVPVGSTSERLALLWSGKETSTIAVLQPTMPVCATQSASAPLRAVTATPILTRGDREFAGNGPDIRIDVSLVVRTQQVGSRRESRVVGRYPMTATEVGGDHTTGAVSGEEVLYTAPDGKTIDAISSATSYTLKFRDDTTTEETFQSSIAAFKVIGDTGGDDIGQTRADTNFHPAQVVLRETKDCVSAQALLRADTAGQLSTATRLLIRPQLDALPATLRTDLQRIRLP